MQSRSMLLRVIESSRESKPLLVTKRNQSAESVLKCDLVKVYFIRCH
jgi:hypothetical protein